MSMKLWRVRAVSAVSLGAAYYGNMVVANADTTYSNVVLSNNDQNTPRMSLTQALKSHQSEVIITDMDIPLVQQTLNNLPFYTDRSAGKGRWVYMYTAQPYAFYRNTKTKEWKMVQVTPYSTHIANTIINGWATSFGYKPFG